MLCCILAICACHAYRYKQVYQYDFKQPGHSVATGAFTQLVWRATTEMGCAARLCSKGIKATTYKEGSIVVCRCAMATVCCMSRAGGLVVIGGWGWGWGWGRGRGARG